MTDEEIEELKKAMDNLKPSDFLNWMISFPVPITMDDEHYSLLDMIVHNQPFPAAPHFDWNRAQQILVKAGFLEWKPSLDAGRDRLQLTDPGWRAYYIEYVRRNLESKS